MKDHYPILIQLSVHSRSKQEIKDRPKADPWPWSNVDKEKYSLLSNYLIKKAKIISQDLPWTVRFKLMNDMMAKAAELSATPDKPAREYRYEKQLKVVKTVRKTRINTWKKRSKLKNRESWLMKTLAKPGFTEERRKVIRIRLMNRQNEIEECGQHLKKQKRELNLETARLEGQARQRRI